MKIREMEYGEIETVRNLRLESYQEYEQFVSKEHWAVLKNTLISDNDLKNNAKIYIAELDGQIAGSVVLFPASIKAYEWNENIQDYPEVRMLSVKPMIRSKGIGGALVEHCIKVSKEENNSHIGLHTASFMTKAISLYESKGFERLPELDLEPMNDGIIVKAFIMDLKRDSK
ncbi:GNAT family N-acetyltransferase [Bacillus sp. ISL-35]|uniref:GNAT family N-acetyltransferase n=1 Tax=Bacillus sp. ISL-35 TaxID=2819122 RepID=UPI001BE77393|nr:GNAT family N-acetyltransferase [Bacillus sp. ISL-35]MBT2704497.1 GNAT family N-acetyltransferase [Chryseobacterium sp. ISL-80]